MITVHREQLLDWIERQRQATDLRTESIMEGLRAALRDADMLKEYMGQIERLHADQRVAEREQEYERSKARDVWDRCAAIGFSPWSPLPLGFMP